MKFKPVRGQISIKYIIIKSIPLYKSSTNIYNSLQFIHTSKMSGFVRASKFRHVYCDAPKVDATLQNLRITTVNGDHNYIKANPFYFAVGLQVKI